MVTFGKVYKNISDIPEGAVINILPVPDYMGVYAWSTPWSCVFIPGFPHYRFQCPSELLNAWGFLDELPNDVIIVSSCSDWDEYARERLAGGWDKMKEALLNPAALAPKKTDTGKTDDAPAKPASAPAATKKAKKADK